MGAMDMHIDRRLVMVHTNHCPAWQHFMFAGLLRHKLYSSPYVHGLKNCIQHIYRKITSTTYNFKEHKTCATKISV